jgi:hypothetical protein
MPKKRQEAIAARGAELLAKHDAWFRAKVQEALDDPRAAIPHKQVEAHFAERRAAALRKAKGIGS